MTAQPMTPVPAGPAACPPEVRSDFSEAMSPHARDTALPEALPEAVPLLEIQPRSGWAALDLAELWKYRDLLWTLAARDVRLRYRQTALGAAWVVLQPLLAAGIFTFVFGKIAGLPTDGIPYFVFSFASLTAWNAFNGTLTKSSASMVGNAPLVSKVYFPRLILPLSVVPSTLIDFVISSVLLIVLMSFNGIAPGWGLLLMPLWLGLLILMAVGIGLYASALMVSYRDLQYVIPVLLQFLLYATPVAYAVSAVPERLRAVICLNPISGLLEAFRWSVMGSGTIDGRSLSYSTAVSLALLAGGAFAFKKMERRFADVI